MKSRRKFTRPLGNRRYRKLFVIAVEGSVTEPDYFKLFQNIEPIVHVKCLTYDKGIDIRNITPDLIDAAISRAKMKEIPPCLDWPRRPGTTVYRLVERIINTV